MNDRFKFRVWDKLSNIMSYEICFGNFFQKSKTEKEVFDWVSVSYGNDGFISYRDSNNFKITDSLKILQSTGLKDKNGKLIYEGDIVKYKNEVYGLCIGKIEWDNAHYELQYYTGEKYGWFSHILCLNHIKNIEVIGNIYENPELLKECE